MSAYMERLKRGASWRGREDERGGEASGERERERGGSVEERRVGRSVGSVVRSEGVRVCAGEGTDLP